jgi:hypothetical protein
VNSWSLNITPTRGGLLSAVWSDTGRNFAMAETNLTSTGGTFYDQESATAIFRNNGGFVFDAIVPPSGDHIPVSTDFPINVNINPTTPDHAGFTTVRDLDLALNLIHPHLNQIRIELISPASFPGGQRTFLLVDNRPGQRPDKGTGSQAFHRSAQ